MMAPWNVKGSGNPFLVSPQVELAQVHSRAARSLHPQAPARNLRHNIFVRASSYDRAAAKKRLEAKMGHCATRLGPRAAGPAGLKSLQHRALSPDQFVNLAKITLGLSLEDDELCELILSFGSSHGGGNSSTIDGCNVYIKLLSMAKDAKLAMHRRNQRRNELQAKRNARPHEKCVEGLLRQKTTRHIDFAFSNFAANRASVEAKLATAALRCGWDKRYAAKSMQAFDTSSLSPTELKDQLKRALNIDLAPLELGALVVVLLEDAEAAGRFKRSGNSGSSSTTTRAIAANVQTDIQGILAEKEVRDDRGRRVVRFATDDAQQKTKNGEEEPVAQERSCASDGTIMDDDDNDDRDHEDTMNNNNNGDDDDDDDDDDEAVDGGAAAARMNERRARAEALRAHPALAAAVAGSGEGNLPHVSGIALMRVMKRLGRAEDSRLKKQHQRRHQYALLRDEIAALEDGDGDGESGGGGGAIAGAAAAASASTKRRLPALLRSLSSPSSSFGASAARAKGGGGGGGGGLPSSLSLLLPAEEEGAEADRARLAAALSKVSAAATAFKGGRGDSSLAALVAANGVPPEKFRRLLRFAFPACRLSPGEARVLAAHLQQRKFSALAAATSASMRSGVAQQPASSPLLLMDGGDFLRLLFNLKVRHQGAGSNGIGISVGDGPGSLTSMAGASSSSSSSSSSSASPAAAQYGALNGGGGATLTTIRRNAIRRAAEAGYR